jgi:hypothetical protein
MATSLSVKKNDINTINNKNFDNINNKINKKNSLFQETIKNTRMVQ